jgi:integrase
MARRTKGTGCLYLRGQIWWMTYYVHGRPVQESTHCAVRADAARKLAEKIGEVAAGRDLTPEKATIADLCELVMVDYRIRRLRDAKTVEWRYKAHIKPALGSLPAAKLTSAAVRGYIEGRRGDGASDATINRELSIIRRGFSLGRDEDPPLVRRAPKVPKIAEDNARQGFLEPEQYERLLEKLPPRLRAIYVCAYHVGTRKGELRKIRIEQVDFEGGQIRVEKKQAKGKRPRTLPIYGDMERWLRRQIDSAPEGCPWVFHNGRGRLVGSQLKGWHEACEAAGLSGLLFHDLRRSAVRNMKRAGISDKTAMDISGHKTRAIFDRYDIVDESDVANAGEKLTEYFEARKQRAKLKRVK